MGYFVADAFGLILAFLNTVTFLLLLYMVLRMVGVSGSRVYGMLDRAFSPVLEPVRRLLKGAGRARTDFSPLIAAAVLQLIALAIRRNRF